MKNEYSGVERNLVLCYSHMPFTTSAGNSLSAGIVN